MTKDQLDKIEIGIQWLNENHPGWHNRIDLDKLNMEIEDDCIIGQLDLLELGKVSKNYVSCYPGLAYDDGLGFFFPDTTSEEDEEIDSYWKDRIEQLKELE